MRVLHIIATLDRAGAEKQLALLAAGLPRDEFDVQVCALTRGGPYERVLREHAVPVCVTNKAWKIDPLAYRRLKEHIAAVAPDVVHTHMFTANAYGRAAARAVGVRNIVSSEYCADPWKGWLHDIVDRRLLRHTDRVIVNAAGVRDFYASRGVPLEKMTLIPSGVPAHTPSTITREQLLAELGLPADAKLLAHVGRLWHQKRIKDVIWAAELLKVARDDTHLLILGDGPQRRALERFRNNVEIQDRVHFLGHRDDAANLLEHFDVLWLASAYEGMPNAILEAMAAGVPVVASDIPGNRELVVSGETGYLVPMGDRAALARYANKIIDDPDLAQRLGDAARERALSEFSVEKMIEAHMKLYRELSPIGVMTND